MARVFVIHGYCGDPAEAWRPWLKDALEKRGYDVFMPAMPDPEHPRVAAWTAALRDVVGKPRPDDVFVGHSLGCIATVRYLETLQPDETVARSIFIAGFYEDLGEDFAEIRSFLEAPVDWYSVKRACESFVVIQSDDDLSVPVERARDFAEKLGVQMEIHTGYGHFSQGDEITELPLLIAKFD